MAYLGQAVAFTRVSVDADGLPTNGDSNPTATLWRNGSSTAETVTVTTTANTGQFGYSFTVPGGWDVNDVLQVVALHAIDSETYRAIVWENIVIPIPFDSSTDTVDVDRIDGVDINLSTLPSSSDHSSWSLIESIRMLVNRFFGQVTHDRPNATINTYDYDETTIITEQAATVVSDVETQGKSGDPS